MPTLFVWWVAGASNIKVRSSVVSPASPLTSHLLMAIHKARRSLKTLPHLPPSPFDRKIKPRRRRIAAVSVHRVPSSPTMSLTHSIPDGEVVENFWPTVAAAATFHPAIYMTIRDAIPPIADAETVERAWVSARKALKTFTDICYRSYLNDAVSP